MLFGGVYSQLLHENKYHNSIQCFIHTGDNSAELQASSFAWVLSFPSSVRIVLWLARAGLPSHPQSPMPAWSPRALGVSVSIMGYQGVGRQAEKKSVVILGKRQDELASTTTPPVGLPSHCIGISKLAGA